MMLEDLYSINGFTTIFYSSILLVVLLFVIKFYYYRPYFLNHNAKIFSWCYVVFLLFLIGLRPLGQSGFTDSAMYIEWLNEARNGSDFTFLKDFGFGLLIYVTSFFPDRFLFMLCAALSIYLLVITSKKISSKNWFLFFIGTIGTLYYWNHNVFSIRQGLGAAFFLYGIVLNKKTHTYLFLFLAILFHKSYLLPFLAFVIASSLKLNIIYLLVCWAVSIAISYNFGNKIEFIVGHFVSFFDSRSDYFLIPNAMMNDAKTGFRLDMIAYSFIYILWGLHYHRKLDDKKYDLFYRFYILVNIFFILIIEVSHSYRFAYLSWFLTPLIVYYPLLKNDKKIDNAFWLTIVFFLSLIMVYISLKNLY